MKIFAFMYKELFFKNRTYIWSSFAFLLPVAMIVYPPNKVPRDCIYSYITFFAIASVSYLFLPSLFVSTLRRFKRKLTGNPRPYCKGIQVLKQTLQTLNSYRLNERADLYSFRKSLSKSCDVAAEFFSDYTSSQVAVSIKIIEEVNKDGIPELCAVNFCRDTHSSSKRDSKEYDDIKHYLSLNTPYWDIFSDMDLKKNDVHYMNNNVQDITKKEYLSTSLVYYSKGEGDLNKLPYKSELVVPILPILTKKQDKQDLLGFFCIDSKQPYSFNGSYDLELSQCISDALYDIIKCYYNNMHNEQKEEKI